MAYLTMSSAGMGFTLPIPPTSPKAMRMEIVSKPQLRTRSETYRRNHQDFPCLNQHCLRHPSLREQYREDPEKSPGMMETCWFMPSLLLMSMRLWRLSGRRSQHHLRQQRHRRQQQQRRRHLLLLNPHPQQLHTRQLLFNHHRLSLVHYQFLAKFLRFQLLCHLHRVKVKFPHR